MFPALLLFAALDANATPPTQIAPETMGPLHNAALDYALRTADVDANLTRVNAQLRVGMVDYLCVEYAASLPSGRLPGLGSREACEADAAHQLLEADRRGPISVDDVLQRLPADAPETAYLNRLVDLVGQLGEDRLDLDGFRRQWQGLSAEIEAADLDDDAREMLGIALSITLSSTEYWSAVREDPTHGWNQIGRDLCGDGDPGPNRASWPEILYADAMAGIEAWLDGEDDHSIFWGAAVASLEVQQGR